ncbi:hypothetical protein RIF25_10570 [Thermosynechococcaceae cyanobacterium BACA0444]|uniref:Uncharacterized protein n=1 Tax=Pseudocalidococcus azoricus BACA0444 TaxID=2918990 RepID=A0AAE4FUS9_9CYAN|nr:hypothetical protein [Pseudocalidococcus azoricus]MDS3861250.1 hypothetical protein [Pseudocalidococcus azoricus BACA0444]
MIVVLRTSLKSLQQKMYKMTQLIALQALTRLAEDPQAIGRLLESLGELPNIPMPTMGGYVFWTDLGNIHGWRLQRNNVFGNYRILDPENVRRAWGGESAMIRAFGVLVTPRI